MDISYKKLTTNDISDFDDIARWDNDKEIQHFLIPNFKNEEIPDITGEKLAGFLRGNESHKEIYMIIAQGENIGCFSIEFEFPHLYLKEKSTWISMCIGEKRFLGKGMAKKAMEFIENYSKERGYNRIELGVFEFNEKAQALYKKCGFQEIGRIPEFTYYNGNKYDDIRMEKRF